MQSTHNLLLKQFGCRKNINPILINHKNGYRWPLAGWLARRASGWLAATLLDRHAALLARSRWLARRLSPRHRVAGRRAAGCE